MQNTVASLKSTILGPPKFLADYATARHACEKVRWNKWNFRRTSIV